MDGYMTHTVGVGDSIQRLAAVYGVEDWREIVRVNNLYPPYIDDRLPTENDPTYLGKVARPGNSLIIPLVYTNPISARFAINNDVEKQAYGTDLDIFTYNGNNTQNLNTQGQLDDNGLGDLSLADGVNNLRQRIITKLLVPLGAFLLYPNFGSRLQYLTGLPNTKETSNKIQVEIRKNILSDNMVSHIENLEIERFKSGLAVSCTVYPIPPFDPFLLSESLVMK